MSKTLAVINIFLVIADLVLSALAACAFAWCAFFFQKWWIILFTLVPVILYNNHSIIVDNSIQQKEGEEDS